MFQPMHTVSSTAAQTNAQPVCQPFKGLDPKVLGTHRFAFLAALRCKDARLTEEHAKNLINTQEGLMNRPFKPREVTEAVSSAYSESGRAKSPAWPPLNTGKRAGVVANGHTVETLQHASPVSGGKDAPDTEDIIDLLFPGNPLLCVGAAKWSCRTQEREIWRGNLSSLQLIVPSPMSSYRGKTRLGKDSPHTLENTGPRRFIVAEQDTGSLDEQAAVLLHLASKWPLALVCHSGGKSLHGWFVAEGYSEEKLRGFFQYAVSLGADPALWTRSQFVRLPGGMRDTGALQEIIYFNPSVIK